MTQERESTMSRDGRYRHTMWRLEDATLDLTLHETATAAIEHLVDFDEPIAHAAPPAGGLAGRPTPTAAAVNDGDDGKWHEMGIPLP
jgi:hypothetical protein